MADAIIGYSGFVGSTLCRQRSFNSFFRSNNIQDIRDRSFDLVVCAGAPAQKWLANKEPIADADNINQLISHLQSINSKMFVLISTVDVFQNPQNVNEDTLVPEQGLHPYGLHRRQLEKFVLDNFPNCLIVRLPGLVGPGLRKNIIFDIKTQNNTTNIDHRCVFQFYPMVNLWYDIEIALHYQLKIIHLTAEPLSVEEVAWLGFGKEFSQILDNDPMHYDFQSKYAELYNNQTLYQYSKRESLQAIRAYAQTEHEVRERSCA